MKKSFPGKSLVWTQTFLAALAGGAPLYRAESTANATERAVSATMERGQREARQRRAAIQAAAKPGAWVRLSDDYGVIIRVESSKAYLPGGVNVSIYDLAEDDACEVVDLQAIVQAALTPEPNAAISLVWEDDNLDAHERARLSERSPKIVDVILEGRSITCSQWDALLALRPALPLDATGDASYVGRDGFLKARCP